jgi:hypothetical protein
MGLTIMYEYIKGETCAKIWKIRKLHCRYICNEDAVKPVPLAGFDSKGEFWEIAIHSQS